MRFEKLFRIDFFICFAVFLVFSKLLTGNNFFLLCFLLVIALGIFRENLEGKIKFLLFFSTWVYVLKLEEDGFSFFHLLQIIYMISSLLTIIMKKIKINIKVLLGYLLFVLYILINLCINYRVNLLEVFGFLLNFTTVAIALATIRSHKYFNINVNYYAMGLIVSGIIAWSGEYLSNVKNSINNIAGNFTVYQNNHLYTRFSGLDIDPNYFAFQVLFAISLLIVISSYKQYRLKENLMIIILILMGISTLSKMFFIMLVFLITFICFFYLKNDILAAIKYIVILFFIFLAMISTRLIDIIKTTLYRFTLNGNSTGSITTGRSDIWISYFEEILSGLRVFLLGNGIGIDFLGGTAAHNMYLLFWYYSGLIGIISLLIFIFLSYSHIKAQVHLGSTTSKNGITKLPLIILLIANFSLDSVMMDYFPLFIFLTILTCTYVGKTNPIKANDETLLLRN